MSILRAWKLNGKGGGAPLNRSEVAEALAKNEQVWLHLDAAATSTRKLLMELGAHFDNEAISALTAKDTRPRVLRLAKGLLINLRTINFNVKADPADMVSARIWIDAETILSVRMRRLRETQVIESRIKDGTGPESADSFLVLFITEMVQSLEQQLLTQADTVDGLELELIEDKLDLSVRKSAMALRRQMIAYRRHLIPQRDMLSSLLREDVSFISRVNYHKLQDLHDQVTRHVEEIEVLRERSLMITEEITSHYSERQNRNMYILSMVAAIFLPLSFLTGLLGINVGGIPGATNLDAFYIFCGLLVLVSLLQFVIFKKLKWL